MKKYQKIVISMALVASTSLLATGCGSKSESEGDETTAVTTGIEVMQETLPPETAYAVETVPLTMMTTAEETTTVPVTETEEETTTPPTLPPETETTTSYSYPIITYQTTSRYYPSYNYTTKATTTTTTTTAPITTTEAANETTVEPEKDPTKKELLEIARKGFVGFVYSDDERLLNYTNIDLYCTLVGAYKLDAVNGNSNTKTTVDLVDARNQYRKLLNTDALETVKFLSVNCKLTQGEVQSYNKRLRLTYSGGDVLDIKSGFPYEIEAAYKIEITYDTLSSGEVVYEGEQPCMLVVKMNGEWVLDISTTLLENTTERSLEYYEDEQARQEAEEEAARLAEEEAAEKKEQQEAFNKRLQWYQEQQEAKEEQEEKEKERQEKVTELNAEYNKQYTTIQKVRTQWNTRKAEFEKIKAEFEKYTEEYEAIYAEYMQLLKEGRLTKDDPQYIYYNTYITNYEKAKKEYEEEKDEYEKDEEEYEKAEEEWADYQADYRAKLAEINSGS